MGGPAGDRDIQPGPEHHGRDQRDDEAHRLIVERSEEVAAHEPCGGGGHAAGRTGDSRDGEERAGLEPGLGMCSHTGGGGGEPGAHHEHRQARQRDRERDEPAED